MRHASHSAINSYTRCGKAYELEKIKNYPTTPAWYLIGGSAVHKITEYIDLEVFSPFELEELARTTLATEMAKALEIQPEMELWLAGGWGKNQQRYDYWNDKVVEYAWQWYEQEWTVDGDLHFVELDVSMVLPSGIEVKGYVDRVKIYHGEDVGFIEVTDLKTGSTRPDSDQQLGMYSVLTTEWLKRNTELYLPRYLVQASNYMFKDNEYYDVPVSRWNLETLDKMAQSWYSGVSNEVFLPVRGKGCERCSVRDACYLQSGDTDTTREFDSLNPFYIGV